jgi:hypothetical protein
METAASCSLAHHTDVYGEAGQASRYRGDQVWICYWICFDMFVNTTVNQMIETGFDSVGML